MNNKFTMNIPDFYVNKNGHNIEEFDSEYLKLLSDQLDSLIFSIEEHEKKDLTEEKDASAGDNNTGISYEKSGSEADLNNVYYINEIRNSQNRNGAK